MGFKCKGDLCLSLNAVWNRMDLHWELLSLKASQMISKLCTILSTKGHTWKCLIERIWIILKSWIYPMISSRDAGKRVKACMSSAAERRKLVTILKVSDNDKFFNRKIPFPARPTPKRRKNCSPMGKGFFSWCTQVSKAISQIGFLLPAFWSLWRNTLCIDVKALKKVTLSNVMSLKCCKSYINNYRKVSNLL